MTQPTGWAVGELTSGKVTITKPSVETLALSVKFVSAAVDAGKTLPLTKIRIGSMTDMSTYAMCE